MIRALLGMTIAPMTLTACVLASSPQAQVGDRGGTAASGSVTIDRDLLAGLASDVQASLSSLANPRPEQDNAKTRRRLVQFALATPKALPALEQLCDRKLAALERGYAELLDQPIRVAYHKRLRALKPQERREIARVRRVWRNYILKPSTQLHFQKHFLVPATKVGELLLPDVATLETKASKAQLRRMREFNGYRNDVRTALELGEDPTTGKNAPTGIAMPKLTQVRSYDEHLDHLYRTMAIASSVAPREARDILLGNAVAARLIDAEEAEFVLYANEIRALMGVVSWSTDVLACAATRDHSKDRVDGNASGHISKLPGKRGFTHRLRRFGTNASSEGAGGGANGRNYLYQLSYGGGHTGPLYSMKRNRVGCGRFGNCYTSTYAGQKGLMHTCHANTGELFLPPGLQLSDITDKSLEDVYHALIFENYSGARTLLEQAKANSKLDRFLRDYLANVIEVEAAWQLECIARFAAVGDLYSVQRRIRIARGRFGTTLDKQLRNFDRRLATAAGAKLLAVGRRYAEAHTNSDRATIESIAREHGKTVYGSAARHFLTESKAGKKPHALQWFLTIDPHLARFEYLTQK